MVVKRYTILQNKREKLCVKKFNGTFNLLRSRSEKSTSRHSLASKIRR